MYYSRMEKVLEYLESNKEKQLDELFELLKIPSISAQSEHDKDTRAAAEWLRAHFEAIGMENAQVLETAGHPVVYADWLHAEDRPTILIYGHYDVQSPDPLDEWESKPFEPELRNGNIYGRGTADDKGQLMTHLKSIEALMAVNEKLPVNVKFLIEGEEEVGGPSLDAFIEENQELLNADVCIISDSHALSPTQPQIVYGLRGLVYTQIDLSIMPKDAHSGEYGGNITNAGNELANIIAKLKNPETQKILVPGFYENVRELTSEEKNELAEAEFNEESVLEESGVKELVGVEGKSPAERAGAQPTLDVNGMNSGYLGEGPKTIIPAKASAKISMRIVPNQTAEEIEGKFKAFLNEIVPDYIDYEVKTLSTGEPIIMKRDGEYFKKAEIVMEKVFGNPPIYELLGGSIPVTATLKTLLGIDSILMGFGLPDDGLHSPNEKMNLEMFYKGIRCSVEYLLAFEN